MLLWTCARASAKQTGRFTIKPSSAKQKGRLLQQWVAKKIIKAFGLDTRDAVSTSMGAGGADVKLSAEAFRRLPVSIECKSLASFAGYKFMDQANEHVKVSGGIPLVFVKANLRSPLVILDAETFLSIARRSGFTEWMDAHEKGSKDV